MLIISGSWLGNRTPQRGMGGVNGVAVDGQRQTNNNHATQGGHRPMGKITVTKTFTSKNYTNPVAVGVKVGRKTFDLNRTSADDIKAFFEGKFEVSVQDLRNIATFVLRRAKDNEYKRLKYNDKGTCQRYEAASGKCSNRLKASYTKKAKANRDCYEHIVAIGKAMTA